MLKIIFAICALIYAPIAFGQNAIELNNKSKEFLTKGDYKSAVPLIKQAAEKGNAEAQYNYGVCFQQGVEVSKNDSIANLWFANSAKQGWKDAQFKLAYSFATGRGVKKDYHQAFQWSLKCAEQNDPECMFNVANCYHEGIGIEKNLDSMLIWATKLALLENPENLQLSGKITSARANLAMMYRDGEVVKQDNLKSYTWYLIYNESKRDFSILVQQQNIDFIKELEIKLTVVDRDKAKSDAETLLNRKLANLANLYQQEF